MKKLLLIILSFLIAACNAPPKVNQDESDESGPVHPYTKKEGVLNVLVDNSMSSYFLYRGEPRGFEYEMLTLFAEEHNLELRIQTTANIENMFDSILYGSTDLVAANLAITPARKEFISFTRPLLYTRQVLVQRKPQNIGHMTYEQIEQSLVRDVRELDGDTVTVRRNSSFALRLENLNIESDANIEIELADSNLTTEELIQMVSDGRITYTVADENIANIFAGYHANIDIRTPVSFSQKIAWAINPQADSLEKTLNAWIEANENSAEFNILKNRYYRQRRAGRRSYQLTVDEVKEGRISKYDDLIEKYAISIGWDPLLLAALINQESGFDASATSKFNARGLMQVMPATASDMGVNPDDLFNPESNLIAGTKYLKTIENRLKEYGIPDDQIQYFVLASYNVGLGHVLDARRLAEKYDRDQNQWFDHTDSLLLFKSKPKYYRDEATRHGYCRGREPFEYVRDIQRYYEIYKTFE